MDGKQLSKIRMSVSRARNAGTRIRYSPFVREMIAKWLSAGESADLIAEQTGIGLQTILRWSEPVDSSFQHIDVKPEKSSSQKLILRLENGVRISAPTAELMIEMLEALK